MATVQTFRNAELDLGRLSLRLDAAFVGVSGLSLLLGARPIGEFLGWGATAAIALTGLAFLPLAAWMGWESTHRRLQRRDLLVPMVLNDAWVLASATVLLSGTPELTTGGSWAVGLVAGVVGAIASTQWIALRQLPAGH